ncbi:MAG: tetratricopeptide repeat protein [bacterium]
MKFKLIICALFFVLIQGFACSSDFVMGARYYIDREKWDEAETYLLKEININPQSDEAYFLLGYVKAEKKEYKEMEIAFSKSLDISDRFKDKIEEAIIVYERIKNETK